MLCNIRLASADDVPAILNIYAHYVRDTVITFEYDVPDEDAFYARFKNVSKKSPWFVCEIDGQIAGYSYAHQYREREAYNWSVECSIYVDSRYHSRNIGKALYSCLLDTLALQGYITALGIVTVPNEKSERLHASFGFKQIGVLKDIGFKAGKWCDVAYYAARIGELSNPPKPPRSVWEVSDTPEFEAVLKKAVSMIKG